MPSGSPALVPNLGSNTVQAILALLVLIVMAYTTGIVVVMLTFYALAARIIDDAHSRRLAYLHDLHLVAQAGRGSAKSR
jgi:hypothetical protein